MRQLQLTVLDGANGLPLQKCWKCGAFKVHVQATDQLQAACGVPATDEVCLGSKLCMLGALSLIEKLRSGVR